jgi:hypothetical protein
MWVPDAPVGSLKTLFNKGFQRLGVPSNPVENWPKALSLCHRCTEPAPDLAMLARGQGAIGIGRIDGRENVGAAIAERIKHVEAGKVCVIDVYVSPDLDQRRKDADKETTARNRTQTVPRGERMSKKTRIGRRSRTVAVLPTVCVSIALTVPPASPIELARFPKALAAF